jgi:hypothetical protein
MKPIHILQQQGRWLIFDGDTVSRVETRPRLEHAAMVVADFEGAVSSVITLEGSPTHAVALIQKRLRSDGMIDTESKVLIHKTLVRGAGYQTLFTAVPLELWQQTYAWAEAQPDHCLLIPCTSLLWRALKPGQGLVLQSGRQVSVLVLLKHQMVYRSALAYSDDPTDLMMTVGVLADQVAGDLDKGEEDQEPPQMTWCSALSARPADDQPWPDDQLREVFSARSGLGIAPAATRLVRDADGVQFRSGIEWLAAHASVFSAVNPASSRVAYLAERLLPLASAASLVVAIALGGIGARWALTARHADQRSAAIQRQVQQIQTNIAALEARSQLDPAFEATRAFVERAAQLQTGIDPVVATRQVRTAADGQVQVLRVRIDTLRPAGMPAAAAPVPGAPPPERVLRVDGTGDPALGSPGMQVATFVERLRQAGYEPTALDPQANGVNTRGGGSVFSYLLKQATGGMTGAAGAPSS